MTEGHSTGGGSTRRGWLGWLVMAGSLAASYGLGLLYFLRFLLPVRRQRWRELFVATVEQIPPGSNRRFVDPAGSETFVFNFGGQLVALSNICPHLGCKVHYQANEKRFFCPCHNGEFDLQGNPTAGPPKAENRALKRSEVVVRGGAIYLRWREV
jgi:nitrite reductase/ring-hydroxylating ferredoxin subunit